MIVQDQLEGLPDRELWSRFSGEEDDTTVWALAKEVNKRLGSNPSSTFLQGLGETLLNYMHRRGLL